MQVLKIVLALSIFAIMVLFFGKPFESYECRQNRFKKDFEFNGEIRSKHFNSKYSDAELVYFFNGEKFVWDNDIYNLYDSLQIGDRLIKSKNSLYLIRVRKGAKDTFSLQLNCKEKK